MLTICLLRKGNFYLIFNIYSPAVNTNFDVKHERQSFNFFLRDFVCFFLLLFQSFITAYNDDNCRHLYLFKKRCKDSESIVRNKQVICLVFIRYSVLQVVGIRTRDEPKQITVDEICW